MITFLTTGSAISAFVLFGISVAWFIEVGKKTSIPLFVASFLMFWLFAYLVPFDIIDENGKLAKDIDYWAEIDDKQIKMAIVDALADDKITYGEHTSICDLVRSKAVQQLHPASITFKTIKDKILQDEEMANYAELTNAKKFVLGE